MIVWHRLCVHESCVAIAAGVKTTIEDVGTEKPKVFCPEVRAGFFYAMYLIVIFQVFIYSLSCQF